MSEVLSVRSWSVLIGSLVKLQFENGSSARVHVGQNQSSVPHAESCWYFSLLMLQQDACAHISQLSHWIPRCLFVTLLLHSVHGCFNGPGLISMSPESSSSQYVDGIGDRWFFL